MKLLEKIKVPYALLFLYIILFIIFSFNPYDRTVWIVENITILLIVLILVFTYRYYQFSNTSYIMMSCLIFLHTIGGHYSFARVPFDFITNFFGFDRNHFDRVAHFTVGFFAFAIAELLHKKKMVNNKWLVILVPIFFIMALACAYEIFEWQYAVTSDSNAGIEILGSQGDIWDAQKDMLSDTLGAITAILFFYLLYRKELKLNYS